MSTKVYEAYRLKRIADLWPFVRDTRRKAEQRAKDILRRVLVMLADNVNESSEAFLTAQKERPNSDAREVRIHLAERGLLTAYREQLTRSEKSMFDFSASIAFHPWAKRIYLIPYRGLPFGVRREDNIYGDVFAFLRRDPRLEDFSYWNNTDKPRHISQREWDARGRVWDAMDKDWQTMLILDVASAEIFQHSLNPTLDVLREYWKTKREALGAKAVT